MQFTGVVGRGTGGDRRGGAGGGILARFRRLLTKGFIRGEKLEKHTSVAKATVHFVRITPGINPRPTARWSIFSKLWRRAMARLPRTYFGGAGAR